jgi:hypothetical protein
LNQDTVLTIFVAVTAVAVVLQMAILLGLFLTVKQAAERFARIAEDTQRKLDPILASAREVTSDAAPKFKEISSNLLEVSASFRLQAERLNSALSDIVGRVTSEVGHAQQVVSDTIDSVEKTRNKVENTVTKPVRTMSAAIEALSVGLGVLLGRDRKEPPRGGDRKDEMFI